MDRRLGGTACVLALVLSGCATQKTWFATGGSKSDATVKLSYEYGLFEKPVVDYQQAAALANQKCTVWGYSGAEAFGGRMQTCNAHNGYGNCVDWTVTAEFQCTGGTTVQPVQRVPPAPCQNSDGSACTPTH